MVSSRSMSQNCVQQPLRIYDPNPRSSGNLLPGMLAPEFDSELRIPKHLPRTTPPNSQYRYETTPIYADLTCVKALYESRIERLGRAYTSTAPMFLTLQCPSPTNHSLMVHSYLIGYPSNTFKITFHGTGRIHILPLTPPLKTSLNYLQKAIIPISGD